MPLVERYSYGEQERRFAAACDWFEAAGVDLNRTRAVEYRRILNEIADHHSRHDIDALIERRSFPHLINAIAEASEFIDIHAGLRELSRTDELATRLRSFVGGTAILADESAQANHPRNIGFELSIAATAAKGGLPVELGAAADVTIPLTPFPFFVECKRPFGERKVQNRIRKGLNQLVRRYEASDRPLDARGFIAVSISKLVNDGSHILRVPNEDDVEGEANRILDAYIRRYQTYWQATDRRTTSVLFELRTPCHIESLSLLTVARFFAFAMVAVSGSAEHGDFQTIATAFRAAGQRT